MLVCCCCCCCHHSRCSADLLISISSSLKTQPLLQNITVWLIGMKRDRNCYSCCIGLTRGSCQISNRSVWPDRIVPGNPGTETKLNFFPLITVLSGQCSFNEILHNIKKKWPERWECQSSWVYLQATSQILRMHSLYFVKHAVNESGCIMNCLSYNKLDIFKLYGAYAC